MTFLANIQRIHTRRREIKSSKLKRTVSWNATKGEVQPADFDRHALSNPPPTCPFDRARPYFTEHYPWLIFDVDSIFFKCFFAHVQTFILFLRFRV